MLVVRVVNLKGVKIVKREGVNLRVKSVEGNNPRIYEMSFMLRDQGYQVNI